jgi:hypothetical protein
MFHHGFLLLFLFLVLLLSFWFCNYNVFSQWASQHHGWILMLWETLWALSVKALLSIMLGVITSGTHGYVHLGEFCGEIEKWEHKIIDVIDLMTLVNSRNLFLYWCGRKEVRICETLEWKKTGWISMIDHGDAIVYNLISFGIGLRLYFLHMAH